MVFSVILVKTSFGFAETGFGENDVIQDTIPFLQIPDHFRTLDNTIDETFLLGYAEWFSEDRGVRVQSITVFENGVCVGHRTFPVI